MAMKYIQTQILEKDFMKLKIVAMQQGKSLYKLSQEIVLEWLKNNPTILKEEEEENGKKETGKED